MLVPPQQPAALSAALIEASGRTWDTAAIVAHARRFSWDDNIDRMDQLLQGMLADAPAPAG